MIYMSLFSPIIVYENSISKLVGYFVSSFKCVNFTTSCEMIHIIKGSHKYIDLYLYLSYRMGRLLNKENNRPKKRKAVFVII